MVYEMDDFSVDVIEQSYSVPVVVDFWAQWCAPCRVLGPVLEKLAKENKGRWVLVKVDVDKHPQIAARYGVTSIPNVKLFVNGRVVDEFVGALPEEAVIQWLKKALPSRYSGMIQEAERMLLENRFEDARKILEEVIGAEPENERALILLAKTYLFSDPSKAFELVGGIEKDPSGIVEVVGVFKRLFEYLRNPGLLPEDPVKDIYLKAIASLFSQDFEKALNGFIEVMGKNRYYDDDGARKACIAVFRFLGEDHEVTQNYRRVFSRVLYS